MTTLAKIAEATDSDEVPIAAKLGQFAHDLTWNAVPADVRVRAKHLILDATGLAMVAAKAEFAEVMLRGLSAMGRSDECSVLGRQERLALRDAATMNAALVHGLDFDDTHMKAVVHGSAVSWPTALTLGEHLDVSGRDILLAYILGMETAIRVGMAADYGFHRNAFHATGVVGHFSSAVTAGRLLQLTADQLAAAQGVVLSTATASREYLEDGSWNKRLHPGWGAVAGITAAHLVKAGFVASQRPYGGRFNIFRMTMGAEADGVQTSVLTDDLGERWEFMDSAVKPFPTCHYTHALADAAITLRRTHDLTAGNIASIHILMPEPVMGVLTEPDDLNRQPPSDYAAKFSASYVVATGLAHGCLGLAELEPDALRDPTTLALTAKCTYAADPDSRFPEYFSGAVVVTTKDGRELRHHEPINRGAGDRQLSNQEIVEKYNDNAGPVLGSARADEVRELLLGLDEHGGRGLARALAG